jgi:predicted PhzF superfamily epimerase YddE/YHI9
VFPDGRGLSDDAGPGAGDESFKTTFVSHVIGHRAERVKVRIFTVQEELPFADIPRWHCFALRGS